MQIMIELNKFQIFPYVSRLASGLVCAVALIVSGCAGGAV